MNRSSNRSDEQKLIRLRRSQKENEQIIEKQKKRSLYSRKARQIFPRSHQKVREGEAVSGPTNSFTYVGSKKPSNLPDI